VCLALCSRAKRNTSCLLGDCVRLLIISSLFLLMYTAGPSKKEAQAQRERERQTTIVSRLFHPLSSGWPCFCPTERDRELQRREETPTKQPKSRREISPSTAHASTGQIYHHPIRVTFSKGSSSASISKN